MIRFLTHAYGEFLEGRTLGQVAWAHFDLLWIHAGHVSLQVGDPPASAVELSAGSGILIYPETYFEGKGGRGRSFASVQHFAIDAETPAGSLPEPLEQLRNCARGFTTFTEVDASLEGDIDRAIEWSYERETPLHYAMRVAHLTIVLGRLFAQPPVGSTGSLSRARIAKVVKMLESRLTGPVSLDEMAARAGISTSHFRAEFRQQMGTSPGAFHLDLRMREAARLLRTTQQSVKQVASSIGYRDVPNFCRAFRSYANATPKRYRSQHSWIG